MILSFFGTAEGLLICQRLSRESLTLVVQAWPVLRRVEECDGSSGAFIARVPHTSGQSLAGPAACGGVRRVERIVYRASPSH